MTDHYRHHNHTFAGTDLEQAILQAPARRMNVLTAQISAKMGWVPFCEWASQQPEEPTERLVAFEAKLLMVRPELCKHQDPERVEYDATDDGWRCMACGGHKMTDAEMNYFLGNDVQEYSELP